MSGAQQPAGWYYAQGDPPGTQRYWNGEQWEGESQPVPGAPEELDTGPLPADVGKRVGGRFLDGILWVIVNFVLEAIIIGPTGGFSPTGNLDVGYGRALLAGVVVTLVLSAYEILMVASRGATLGKLAVGTRVVKADGSPVDLNDAVRRISPYLVLGMLAAVLAPVGYVFRITQFFIGLVSIVLPVHRPAAADGVG